MSVVPDHPIPVPPLFQIPQVVVPSVFSHSFIRAKQVSLNFVSCDASLTELHDLCNKKPQELQNGDGNGGSRSTISIYKTVHFNGFKNTGRVFLFIYD